MAYNDTIAVLAAWTLLTNSNVAGITFQNQGEPIYVQATVGNVVPVNETGLLYPNMNGETASLTLALAFPGVAGANRVWARNAAGFYTSKVFVSHA